MFSVCFAFCIKENEWKQEGVGDIHCLVNGYKMVTQFFWICNGIEFEYMVSINATN